MSRGCATREKSKHERRCAKNLGNRNPRYQKKMERAKREKKKIAVVENRDAWHKTSVEKPA